MENQVNNRVSKIGNGVLKSKKRINVYIYFGDDVPQEATAQLLALLDEAVEIVEKRSQFDIHVITVHKHREGLGRVMQLEGTRYKERSVKS